MFRAKETTRQNIASKSRKEKISAGEDGGNDETSGEEVASIQTVVVHDDTPGQKFRAAKRTFKPAQVKFRNTELKFKTAQLEFKAVDKTVPIEIDTIVIHDDEPPAKRPRTEVIEEDDTLEIKEQHERKLMGEIIKMRIAKIRREREVAKIKAAEE